MRVMCINQDTFGLPSYPYGPNDPEIGEECEVLESCNGVTFDHQRVPSFKLKGYNKYVYDQRNFATLPDVPEEIIEELELATA